MPKILIPPRRPRPSATFRKHRTSLVIAGACVALLLGVGLGLLVFRGTGQSTRDSGEPMTRQTLGCSSEALATALDETKVPDGGAATEAALNKAVALYFVCESLPLDRFARSFATLSVVLAQYAPDAACFNGDPQAADKEWSGHKAWAEKQGGSDPLVANLRLKIGQVLPCLSPDQQRLLFVDFAHAFAFVTAGQTMQTFVNPTFKGQRVDRCLFQGRDCNETAAQTWCRRYGYDRMAKWEWVYVPQSITLGDNKTCTSSCAAFTTIVCAQ
jgi:hypothetical protein